MFDQLGVSHNQKIFHAGEKAKIWQWSATSIIGSILNYALNAWPPRTALSQSALRRCVTIIWGPDNSTLPMQDLSVEVILIADERILSGPSSVMAP